MHFRVDSGVTHSFLLHQKADQRKLHMAPALHTHTHTTYGNNPSRREDANSTSTVLINVGSSLCVCLHTCMPGSNTFKCRTDKIINKLSIYRTPHSSLHMSFTYSNTEKKQGTSLLRSTSRTTFSSTTQSFLRMFSHLLPCSVLLYYISHHYSMAVWSQHGGNPNSTS